MDKELRSTTLGEWETASAAGKMFSWIVPKWAFSFIVFLLSGLCALAEAGSQSVITTTSSGSQWNLSLSGGVTTTVTFPGYGVQSFGPPPPAILCNGFPPLPSNDNFANATILTGMSSGICGANALIQIFGVPNWQATAEPGEPDHGGIPAANSVWYRWTAPATGMVQITTSPLIAIYTGATLSTLVPVTNNASELFAFGSGDIRFPVTAGETYQIAVDRRALQSPLGIYGFPPGQFNLTVQLASLQLVSSGTNGTIGQPIDLEYAPYGEGPELSQLNLMVDGTLVDTLTNAPWRFTYIPTNSQTASVWAEGTTTNGEYVIAWPSTFTFRPANDDFTNATQIESISGGSFSGDTSTATAEPGEPETTPGNPAVASVWWKWVAPYSAETKITLPTGSSLTGYQGETLDSLEQIFHLTGSISPIFTFPPPPPPTASFQAVAGTTYYFSAQGGSSTLFSTPWSTQPIHWTLDQQTLELQPANTQIGWVNLPILLNAISIETNVPPVHVDFILGAQQMVFPSFSSSQPLYMIGSLGTLTNPPYNLSWTPNQTGMLYVWARSTNSQGIVHESAPTTFEVLAENDLFSHATVIAPDTQSTNFNFDTQWTSAEPSEPRHGNAAARFTQWWKWTPSYSGTVRIKAVRDLYGLPLEVFAGTDLQHLRLLAHNRNKVSIPGLSGIIRLKLLAGKTYYIRTDEIAPAPQIPPGFSRTEATLMIEPANLPLPGELNFSLMLGSYHRKGKTFIISLARVFETDGRTPLNGDHYHAQLYVGHRRADLAAVGTPRVFSTTWPSQPPSPWAGLFSPAPVFLPDVAPGQSVFAQIRVWDSNYGDSFEAAKANGSPIGTSTIVNVKAGSEETGGTLLWGIRNFSLHGSQSGNGNSTIRLTPSLPGRVGAFPGSFP